MVKYISLVTCLFMLLITSCGAVDYTVGDWAGWTLGLDYTSWSASKNFHVGDNLVFKYSRGHTVGEVNLGDYTSCALEKSISKLAKNRRKRNSGWKHKSDTTIVTLESPGTHYFICAEPGHCAAGMKFAINVSAKGKKSASARAGLSNVPLFIAVLLLALVLF